MEAYFVRLSASSKKVVYIFSQVLKVGTLHLTWWLQTLARYGR